MTGIDSKRQAALNKLFEVENELGLHYDQRTPMTKDEALKLALEALELSAVTVDSFGVQKKTNEAITAIKEALAQPEQEPVAFSCLRCATPKKCAVHGCSPNTWPSESSPKRPWVGLIDKEVRQTLINYNMGALPHRVDCIKAVEAKLKELNT